MIFKLAEFALINLFFFSDYSLIPPFVYSKESTI